MWGRVEHDLTRISIAFSGLSPKCGIYFPKPPKGLEDIYLACKLIPPAGSPAPTPGPPPSGPDTFSAAKGDQITIFADSDSGTARLIAADLNGANVPLDANFKATFDVPAGANIFSMAFAGSDPDEIFRIQEDCGDGSAHTLRTWRLRALVPGGPTTQITINAA
jgi:hypothetical protein